MAVLQGIQGMQMGDSAGGKIALSIQTRVLRILSDAPLTYATATMNDPQSVKAGTATYYVPEMIGSEAYGTGDTAYKVPQSGLVTFNIDTRRTIKWEVETFDIARLDESDYILNMIANGVSMAVQADLNGQFLQYLVKKFDKNTGDSKLKLQVINLSHVTKENPAMTPEEARQDYLTLQYAYNKFNQMYDKNKLGVPKAEIMAFVAPVVDTGLTNAFWNQPNSIGEWVVGKTLMGKQLGNLRYTVDSMLNNKIDADSSFNNDEALDFTKIFGFMLHNEAVAMPININEVIFLRNPNNGNPRWVTKYQFGIGIIRPKLIYKIQDATTNFSAKELKKAEKEAAGE